MGLQPSARYQSRPDIMGAVQGVQGRSIADCGAAAARMFLCRVRRTNTASAVCMPDTECMFLYRCRIRRLEIYSQKHIHPLRALPEAESLQPGEPAHEPRAVINPPSLIMSTQRLGRLWCTTAPSTAVLHGEGRKRPATPKNQHNEQTSRRWKQQTTARSSAKLAIPNKTAP